MATTIKQITTSVAPTPVISLATAPTEGNHLVVLMTCNSTFSVFPPPPVNTGWQRLNWGFGGESAGAHAPVIFAKIAGAGESATLEPTTQGGSIFCMAAFEIDDPVHPGITAADAESPDTYISSVVSEYASTAAYDASPDSASQVSDGVSLWMVIGTGTNAVSGSLSDTPDGTTNTGQRTDTDDARAMWAGYYFTNSGQDLQINPSWNSHGSVGILVANFLADGDGSGSVAFSSDEFVTATVFGEASLPSGFRYTTIRIT